MLILLSPAKSLDFDTPVPDEVASSRPRFEADAHKVARAAARLGARRLGEIMAISPKLAALNADRFRHYEDAAEAPAIFAFAGDVYRGFEARQLDRATLDFADAHVRILSGLYGVLRPYDVIRPYRLEMGTHWAPAGKKTLYAYWGKRVSQALRSDLDAQGTTEILNLASQEYAGVVTQAPPARATIVAADFREIGPKGLRFNSFAAKRARGSMARWCCEQRVERIADVRGFDRDGYSFDPDGSDKATLRFIRSL